MIPGLRKTNSRCESSSARCGRSQRRIDCIWEMRESAESKARERSSGTDLAAVLDTEGISGFRAQLGHIEDYEQFLHELDKVWKHCFEALVPGGRLICVVGDVCLSRGRTAVGTQWSRCMRRFKNTAESSVSTISHRSSGTRFPTRSMRWKTAQDFLEALRAQRGHQERHRVHTDGAQARRIPCARHVDEDPQPHFR